MRWVRAGRQRRMSGDYNQTITGDKSLFLPNSLKMRTFFYLKLGLFSRRCFYCLYLL